MPVVVTSLPASAHALTFDGTDIDSNALEARHVVEGDIDGDGDLDLVSASSMDDTIAWYENTGGDASAWAPTNVDASADGARSVAVGDLDGDGDLDIASASFADSTIAWYKNTAGDGSAWTPANLGIGPGARSVAVGDLDGDGDLDLASANFTDDTISWYNNTAGDGSAWTTTDIDPNANGASSVIVADLDRDSDLDLASASVTDDTIAWYNNTAGNASAWTAADISITANGARSVAAGDLDRDGDLDLASASNVDNEVTWYSNTNGNASTWTPTVIDANGDGAVSVRIADLDSDGDLDIASSSEDDDAISWHENTAGNASAWASVDVAFTADQPVAVATGDLDGDGDVDLASAGFGDDTIAWYRNQIPACSEPSWDDHQVDSSGSQPHWTTPVDIDRDGDVDLVSAQTTDNTLSVHKNTAGDGSTWTTSEITVGVNPVSVAVGDLDGDGDPDLATGNAGDENVVWVENIGGDPTTWPAVEVADSDFPRAVTMADFDGDGDLDLAATAFNDDKVVWFKNVNGDASSWTPFDVGTSFNSALGLTSGDFDGDGDVDLVGTSLSNDLLRLYENTAGNASAWTSTDIEDAPSGTYVVTAADLDGDGDLDLASGGTGNDGVAWHENLNGDATTWNTTFVDATVLYAESVATGDFDDDGDQDLTSTSFVDDTITLHENTLGDASTWVSTDVSTDADGAGGVAGGDIDRDGDLDIVADHGNDQATFWHEAMPTLKVEPATEEEGETLGMVVSAGRLHEAVEVDFTAYPGTASGGSDFVQVTNEHLTIPAGQSETTVNVATVEDEMDEPDEYFYALLANPVNAGIAPGTGLNQNPTLGTMLDDDPVPELSIDNVTVTEKNTEEVDADFTLSLTNPSSVDVTVEAVTTADSATKGDDYTHKSKSVTITAGTTEKTFTVSVAGDKLDEDKEQFFVDLSSPINAVFGDDRGKGTIEDNDDKPKLSAGNVKKKEGDSGKKTFTFKITLGQASGKTVEVDWKTTKKSAKSPKDYVKKDGHVKFSPGVTKKEITVKVKGDKKDEGKETFNIKLSDAVAASLGDSKGKGTIKNDD